MPAQHRETPSTGQHKGTLRQFKVTLRQHKATLRQYAPTALVALKPYAEGHYQHTKAKQQEKQAAIEEEQAAQTLPEHASPQFYQR